MATRTKKRSKRQPVQHPKRAVEQKRGSGRWLWIGAAAIAVAVVAIPAVILASGRGTEKTANAPAGLPDTPDYHSLLVGPGNPNAIVLGTHYGIYESKDGGRSWRKTALDGQDAMNLAAAGRRTVWTAGHNVFARSEDGGLTWRNVEPDGLPHLDIHGFAVDPRDGSLWAALAGDGLYRSRDGGATFELVTRRVGGSVVR